MTILHLALLTPLYDFYDYNLLSIDDLKLEESVKLAQTKYSEKLTNSIIEMLCFDPNLRPDFIELNDKL